MHLAKQSGKTDRADSKNEKLRVFKHLTNGNRKKFNFTRNEIHFNYSEMELFGR